MAGITALQNSQDEPIVGIDLGTTNSLVAFCDETGPRIIPDEQGRHLLPSVVRFNADSGAVEAVGFEARSHVVEFPQQTVFSVKRLMGRGLSDVADELTYLPYRIVAGEQDTARVRVGDTGPVLSPPEISAVILKELRARAERFFGKTVRKAVVTVPAYFDDAQRQATRDAGRIAGLEVVRMVNEPTAASLAYNLGQRHRDATVAVFDLGGGTFDFSILRLQHAGPGTDPGAGATDKRSLRGRSLSVSAKSAPDTDKSSKPALSVAPRTHQPTPSVDQVLATAGDTHLGGDDVDRMIVELIQDEIRQQFGAGLEFPPSTRQAFRTLAEAAKIRLSGGGGGGDQDSANIEIELGEGRTYRRTLTRGQLEKLIEPWLARALDCCRRAVAAAKLKVSDIERVIMVGGSTRIPLVRQRVAEFFKSEPYTALNPDEVVALGAAVQASILAGYNRDMLLLDVIPLSLGIETLGGAVAKVIMANTTIPARAAEKFSTQVDGQTNVKIHVLQGERELVRDCRSLGEFELRGIPPMPAGLPKIRVNFLIDANGILNVTAVEERSGKAASIQIVPNHGLTRQEVAAMEAASLKFARSDMDEHQRIDLRNQAKMDLRNIERQLAQVGSEADTEYRRQIADKMATVQRLIEEPAPDVRLFCQALAEMDRATVRLAEIAIKKALSEGAAE